MNESSHSQQEFISKLSRILEANLGNESFGVSELADAMGMSRSNLHRKVSKISKVSASQFIREYRLQQAIEMLREGSYSVSEVSYKVGFGSAAYFTKCFHDYFGYPPGELGNHEGKNNKPKIRHSRLKSLELDKSDLIVWSIVFILLLNIFFIIFLPKINSPKNQGKAIAIMQFEDLSPSAEKSYIINGLREDILDVLFSVKDIEVVPEALMDQYQNSGLSALEIAKKTKADFILTAKGETSNENTTVWFELLETKSGKVPWRENENLSLSNYFELRKEVAYAVVNELKANLSLQEKEEIEKNPTENMAAYNLYLKGDEYMKISHLNESLVNRNEGHTYRAKAKECYEKAIELDSTFADPYVKLGSYYINVGYQFSKTVELQVAYLDSGFVMAQKALNNAKGRSWETDPNLSWAKGLEAFYYYAKGNKEKAMELYSEMDKYGKGFRNGEFDKYHNLTMRNGLFENYFEMIKNSLKYLELKPELIPTPSYFYRSMYHSFDYTGFNDPAKKYLTDLMNIIDDSVTYYCYLSDLETHSGNYENAGYLINRAYKLDSINLSCKFYLLKNAVFTKKYSDALQLQEDILNNLEERTLFYLIDDFYLYSVFILLQNNKKLEAQELAKKATEYYQKQIDYNTLDAQRYYSHLHLAYVHAITNNNNKALDYLAEVKNRETIPRWLLHELKELPWLDNIRDEPEFQEILGDAETKYQKEHERVGELLREFGEI